MFNADDLIWIDFEVFGGALDLKAAGAFRYVAEASTHTIVLSYAIGNAPALTWHADGVILDWNCAPNELRAAYERRKTFAAWNASFDAAVWNYATLGFPRRNASSIRWSKPAFPTCRPISNTHRAISAAPANRKMAKR